MSSKKQRAKPALLLQDKYSFQRIIEETTGYKVIPFKKEYEELDTLFLQFLDNTIESLTKNARKLKRYDNVSRINELNQDIVSKLASELIQYPYGATLLKPNGYGDILVEMQYTYDQYAKNSKKALTVVTEKKRYYYIEVIATTQDVVNMTKRQDLRVMYLSNLNNIKHDASHLLILMQYDKNNKNSFVFKTWSEYDLINSSYNLKIEYNCSLKDILEMNTI